MMHLLAARLRYVDMRAALPSDCAFGLDLQDELTQAIRRLDRMITRAAGGRLSPDPAALDGAGP